MVLRILVLILRDFLYCSLLQHVFDFYFQEKRISNILLRVYSAGLFPKQMSFAREFCVLLLIPKFSGLFYTFPKLEKIENCSCYRNILYLFRKHFLYQWMTYSNFCNGTSSTKMLQKIVAFCLGSLPFYLFAT